MSPPLIATTEAGSATQDASAARPIDVEIFVPIKATTDNRRSVEVAVVELEKYITDDNRIKLEQLIQQETETAYTKSLEIQVPGQVSPTDPISIAKRLDEYNSIFEVLLALIIRGCYWGAPNQASHWVRSIDRVAGTVGELGSLNAMPGLILYPAMLLLYGGGLASLAGGRFEHLLAVLESPILNGSHGTHPAVLWIGRANKLDPLLRTFPGKGQDHTPTSDYLYEILRNPVEAIEPAQDKYDALFNRFECLLCLTLGHLSPGGLPFPVGRFGWRRTEKNDTIADLSEEHNREKNNWPPIKAGMFGARSQRFVALLGSLESRVNELHWY